MGSEQAMDNKLKQYLVEELGELTYAEKQNIQKTFNWTFLEKELTKVSKQIKATIARIFLTGLLVRSSCSKRYFSRTSQIQLPRISFC